MTLKTHHHDTLSMFQSVADEVAQRQDADAASAATPGSASALGKTPATAAANAAMGSSPGIRPGLDHPVVATAAALATHIEAGGDPADGPPQELQDQHGPVVTELWNCSSTSLDLLKAKLAGDEKKAKALDDELAFSTCDPHWVSAITDYTAYFGVDGNDKQIPYIRHQQMDDFVLETLPRNARVALLGDWGTGTADALALMRQIAALEPQVIIHLGDIYYSGVPPETQKYFLDPINEILERDKNPIPVYNLTGNHDMYSGGLGYYQLLPQLNPAPPFIPAQAQPASYFSLRTPGGTWQLLAMDTSLHDHDPFDVSSNVTYLEPDEEAWHVDKIQRWSAQGGRTILLSHHQLFSRFESVGRAADQPLTVNPRLLASYQKFGQAGDVAAWFWGHEHNLSVFQPFQNLPKGRCIGHGAIPVFTDTDPYQPLQGATDLPKIVPDPNDPTQELQLAAHGGVYQHGFVILDLDDDDGTAKATYYADGGAGEIYGEEI